MDVKASSEPPVARDLDRLVQRAQAGDASALPGIRAILDNHPEIWQYAGDLTASVEHAWITLLSAGNPLAAESTRRTIAQMKKDLLGDHPSQLERLLADQVVSCWMQVRYLECVSAVAEPGSLRQGTQRLRSLESAQARYLKAIKTLTALRALLPEGLAPAGSPRLHKAGARRLA